MKKRILALALALCMLAALCGCKTAAPDVGVTAASKEPPLETPDTPETTAAPETTPPAPLPEAEYLEDFTVTTIDGGSFTLSAALEEHELVLINLFATWCPPCRMEFPYLQEAWEQEQDRVAVIALSVEADDTVGELQDYAAELGLSFPIGRESGVGLERFAANGIPTTVLVDRTGRIAAVEVGALSSTQDFLELFDEYSGADYNPNLCTYYIYAYGAADYADVEGVVINFCTDTTCTPVTTGADGAAVFTGVPARYHVQVVTVPDGWVLTGDSEWTTEPYSQIVWLPLQEDGQ
ncbi:MAG: TlpA family protein disulfide reductase [Oscillospiraceae bacterium]|nr:TlpA family protein disulfide reductase [Oscillospiraceae bacterium]